MKNATENEIKKLITEYEMYSFRWTKLLANCGETISNICAWYFSRKVERKYKAMKRTLA